MAKRDMTQTLQRNQACVPCKQRKVKCDAKRPICDSCRRCALSHSKPPSSMNCTYLVPSAEEALQIRQLELSEFESKATEAMAWAINQSLNKLARGERGRLRPAEGGQAGNGEEGEGDDADSMMVEGEVEGEDGNRNGNGNGRSRSTSANIGKGKRAQSTSSSSLGDRSQSKDLLITPGGTPSTTIPTPNTPGSALTSVSTPGSGPALGFQTNNQDVSNSSSHQKFLSSVLGLTSLASLGSHPASGSVSGPGSSDPSDDNKTPSNPHAYALAALMGKKMPEISMEGLAGVKRSWEMMEGKEQGQDAGAEASSSKRTRLPHNGSHPPSPNGEPSSSPISHTRSIPDSDNKDPDDPFPQHSKFSSANLINFPFFKNHQPASKHPDAIPPPGMTAAQAWKANIRKRLAAKGKGGNESGSGSPAAGTTSVPLGGTGSSIGDRAKGYCMSTAVAAALARGKEKEKEETPPTEEQDTTSKMDLARRQMPAPLPTANGNVLSPSFNTSASTSSLPGTRDSRANPLLSSPMASSNSGSRSEPERGPSASSPCSSAASRTSLAMALMSGSSTLPSVNMCASTPTPSPQPQLKVTSQPTSASVLPNNPEFSMIPTLSPSVSSSQGLPPLGAGHVPGSPSMLAASLNDSGTPYSFLPQPLDPLNSTLMSGNRPHNRSGSSASMNTPSLHESPLASSQSHSPLPSTAAHLNQRNYSVGATPAHLASQSHSPAIPPNSALNLSSIQNGAMAGTASQPPPPHPAMMNFGSTQATLDLLFGLSSLGSVSTSPVVHEPTCPHHPNAVAAFGFGHPNHGFRPVGIPMSTESLLSSLPPTGISSHNFTLPNSNFPWPPPNSMAPFSFVPLPPTATSSSFPLATTSSSAIPMTTTMETTKTTPGPTSEIDEVDLPKASEAALSLARKMAGLPPFPTTSSVMQSGPSSNSKPPKSNQKKTFAKGKGKANDGQETDSHASQKQPQNQRDPTTAHSLVRPRRARELPPETEASQPEQTLFAPNAELFSPAWMSEALAHQHVTGHSLTDLEQTLALFAGPAGSNPPLSVSAPHPSSLHAEPHHALEQPSNEVRMAPPTTVADERLDMDMGSMMAELESAPPPDSIMAELETGPPMLGELPSSSNASNGSTGMDLERGNATEIRKPSESGDQEDQEGSEAKDGTIETAMHATSRPISRQSSTFEYHQVTPNSKEQQTPYSNVPSPVPAVSNLATSIPSSAGVTASTGMIFSPLSIGSIYLGSDTSSVFPHSLGDSPLGGCSSSMAGVSPSPPRAEDGLWELLSLRGERAPPQPPQLPSTSNPTATSSDKDDEAKTSPKQTSEPTHTSGSGVTDSLSWSYEVSNTPSLTPSTTTDNTASTAALSTSSTFATMPSLSASMMMDTDPIVSTSLPPHSRSSSPPDSRDAFSLFLASSPSTSDTMTAEAHSGNLNFRIDFAGLGLDRSFSPNTHASAEKTDAKEADSLTNANGVHPSDNGVFGRMSSETLAPAFLAESSLNVSAGENLKVTSSGDDHQLVITTTVSSVSAAPFSPSKVLPELRVDTNLFMGASSPGGHGILTPSPGGSGLAPGKGRPTPRLTPSASGFSYSALPFPMFGGHWGNGGAPTAGPLSAGLGHIFRWPGGQDDVTAEWFRNGGSEGEDEEVDVGTFQVAQKEKNYGNESDKETRVGNKLATVIGTNEALSEAVISRTGESSLSSYEDEDPPPVISLCDAPALKSSTLALPSSPATSIPGPIPISMPATLKTTTRKSLSPLATISNPSPSAKSELTTPQLPLAPTGHKKEDKKQLAEDVLDVRGRSYSPPRNPTSQIGPFRDYGNSNSQFVHGTKTPQPDFGTSTNPGNPNLALQQNERARNPAESSLQDPPVENATSFSRIRNSNTHNEYDFSLKPLSSTSLERARRDGFARRKGKGNKIGQAEAPFSKPPGDDELFADADGIEEQKDRGEKGLRTKEIRIGSKNDDSRDKLDQQCDITHHFTNSGRLQSPTQSHSCLPVSHTSIANLPREETLIPKCIGSQRQPQPQMSSQPTTTLKPSHQQLKSLPSSQVVDTNGLSSPASAADAIVEDEVLTPNTNSTSIHSSSVATKAFQSPIATQLLTPIISTSSPTSAQVIPKTLIFNQESQTKGEEKSKKLTGSPLSLVPSPACSGLSPTTTTSLATSSASSEISSSKTSTTKNKGRKRFVRASSCPPLLAEEDGENGEGGDEDENDEVNYMLLSSNRKRQRGFEPFRRNSRRKSTAAVAPMATLPAALDQETPAQNPDDDLFRKKSEKGSKKRLKRTVEELEEEKDEFDCDRLSPSSSGPGSPPQHQQPLPLSRLNSQSSRGGLELNLHSATSHASLPSKDAPPAPIRTTRVTRKSTGAITNGDQIGNLPYESASGLSRPTAMSLRSGKTTNPSNHFRPNLVSPSNPYRQSRRRRRNDEDAEVMNQERKVGNSTLNPSSSVRREQDAEGKCNRPDTVNYDEDDDYTSSLSSLDSICAQTGSPVG